MERIIVYGLGNSYRKQRKIIESTFDIIGYSDKSLNNDIQYTPFIEPKDISSKQYDYVYITSQKYFTEIKSQLIYGGVNEQKIISIDDILGKFQNSEIRDKWVINKLSKIRDNIILLDAGAGEMRYAPYCERFRYIAQDFGKYIPHEINKGLQFDKWDTSKVNITCDIIDMPLKDKSVDVILCTEVFEHLKNPVLALKEFSRIIKPKGELLLTAPFCSLSHMVPYYFSNGFSEFWYLENLKDFGFEVKSITPYGNYFEWLGQELCRVSDIAEKYCKLEISQEEIINLVGSIKLMSRLSKQDKGSNEILCFGYMVEAYKIDV